MRNSILAFVLSLAVPALLAGCSCSDPAVGGLDGDTTGMDGGPNNGIDAALPDGAPPADGPVALLDGAVTITEDGGFTWSCVQRTCAGHLLDCGDCEDNDGDGLTDSRDPECLGPCDNTEGPGLNAGIGGETGGPCLADCYFDFGNGSGNDDCRWDHRCDPFSVAPNFYPEGESCALDTDRVGGRTCPDTQSDQCLNFCQPLTPSGCDCFGCCTFDELAGTGPDGSDGFVWLGALDDSGDGTCTFDDINDPSACPTCTPVADCFNDCGRCELCIGRTTLPADCMARPDAGSPYDAGQNAPDAGPVDYRCATGVQECGLAGDAQCAADYYCISGCCQPTIF